MPIAHIYTESTSGGLYLSILVALSLLASSVVTQISWVTYGIYIYIALILPTPSGTFFSVYQRTWIHAQFLMSYSASVQFNVNYVEFAHFYPTTVPHHQAFNLDLYTLVIVLWSFCHVATQFVSTWLWAWLLIPSLTHASWPVALSSGRSSGSQNQASSSKGLVQLIIFFAMWTLRDTNGVDDYKQSLSISSGLEYLSINLADAGPGPCFEPEVVWSLGLRCWGSLMTRMKLIPVVWS